MSNTPKFCRNCGNKLVEGAKFCNKCGTKIIINTESAVASPEVETPVISPVEPEVETSVIPPVESEVSAPVETEEELLKAIEKNLTSSPIVVSDEKVEKNFEPSPVEVPAESWNENAVTDKSSSQNKIIIALCILIFAILVVIGALFATGTIGFSSNKDNNTSVSEEDNILPEKKADSKKAKKSKKADKSDEDGKISDDGKDSETGFILPNSNVSDLKDEEVAALLNDDLRLAINEMYARHGYKFKSEDLQNYFNGKTWYKNENKTEDVVKAEFSEVETRNMVKLTNERSKRGN